MLANPANVPARETVSFVIAHAPPRARVLEIGCGNGDVVAALQREGFAVTGVDADAASVEATRAHGVPALLGEWPEVAVPATFDLVVFTRSLHHIHDLHGALAAARVAPLLLIEDFDFTAANAACVAWLVANVRTATLLGLLREGADEFATRVASAADPMSAWHADHDHDLHSFSAIASATARHFTIVSTAVVPYAYRYLAAVLESTPRAAAWLHEVMNDEPMPIGRRLVAKSRGAAKSD